ncbi:oxidoreductase domain protein [Flammeovirgaceae bacterium 311]|nr:oxidoreductase domain protein [Flammeovirgaceae bacterium 311]
MKANHHPLQEQRRKFLKGFSLALGTTALGVPLFSLSSCQSSNTTGEQAGTVEQGQQNETGSQNRKMGIALVGLGQYSANQLAPALQETQDCYLAGIVTGTPSKADEWKQKYNIPDKNVYNYENFDSIADNPDIDIVYVVLPNSMHAEYTIRAARAKKHVICEKPMATSVEDAQRMLDACRENGVQLAIGYRLHYEPFNLRVMELGQQQVYGKVLSIQAQNSKDVTSGNLDIWRLKKDLAGGGPLMDMGIYAVQGACYTVGKTPVAITAQFGEVTHPTYFYEVEQSISWSMEFDDGLVADCKSSYAENNSFLKGKAENGWWTLDPAYAYDGKKGETHEGNLDLPNIYEQVRQMDGQAQSFRNNQPSKVPGEMGYRDMRILMAIYESARNGGKRITL